MYRKLSFNVQCVCCAVYDERCYVVTICRDGSRMLRFWGRRRWARRL